MISAGRYSYHLADIAAYEALPSHKTDSTLQQMTRSMRAQVAEYEAANGISPSALQTPPPIPESTPEPETKIFALSTSNSPAAAPMFSFMPLESELRPGAAPDGQVCKHGNRHYCGFCSTGNDPTVYRR